MKIESAFRPLSELETALAELYGSWSETLQEDPEASFVFFKMSTEERGHAALVDYQRRFIERIPSAQREVDIDLTDIQVALDRVRILQRRSPSGRPEAIAIAMELENSAAESHFRSAVRQADPEVRRLLDCLGGEDRQHFSRLAELALKGSDLNN